MQQPEQASSPRPTQRLSSRLVVVTTVGWAAVGTPGWHPVPQILEAGAHAGKVKLWVLRADLGMECCSGRLHLGPLGSQAP